MLQLLTSCQIDGYMVYCERIERRGLLAQKKVFVGFVSSILWFGSHVLCRLALGSRSFGSIPTQLYANTLSVLRSLSVMDPHVVRAVIRECSKRIKLALNDSSLLLFFLFFIDKGSKDSMNMNVNLTPQM